MALFHSWMQAPREGGAAGEPLLGTQGLRVPMNLNFQKGNGQGNYAQSFYC